MVTLGGRGGTSKSGTICFGVESRERRSSVRVEASVAVVSIWINLGCRWSLNHSARWGSSLCARVFKPGVRHSAPNATARPEVSQETSDGSFDSLGCPGQLVILWMTGVDLRAR